jgi:hypothetical protein
MKEFKAVLADLVYRGMLSPFFADKLQAIVERLLKEEHPLTYSSTDQSTRS